MSNLATRLDEIERQAHASKGRRLFVTYDNGQSFLDGEHAYSRGELDQLERQGYEVVVLRVAHETARASN